MAERKEAPRSAAANKDTVVSTAGDTELVMRQAGGDTGKVQKAGEKGPPSSLETGVGSPTGAAAGTDAQFEGRRGEATKAKGQIYSVQKHDDENGVQVEYVTAESGDEAALKVLKAAKFKGTSIRGVTPASDPDPNSLGGEREASIMINNAETGDDLINPLGTEANREAREGLGKADVKELGE